MSAVQNETLKNQPLSQSCSASLYILYSDLLARAVVRAIIDRK